MDLQSLNGKIKEEGTNNLKLKQIVLEHIGSHEHTVLDIPDDERLIAISGPTGSGKTTLLEAPFLALYGRSVFRDRNIYGVVTKNYEGPCSVSVTFTVEGSKDISIVRSWIQGEGEAGSRHRTSWNGERLNTREFQDRVESTFGDLDLIRITNYSTQNRISFFSLPISERRVVLGSLLAPQLFKTCEQVSDLAKEKRKEDEKRIDSIKGKSDLLTEQLEHYQERGMDLGPLEEKLTRLVADTADLNARGEKFGIQGTEIREELSKIDAMKNEREEIKQSLDRIKSDLGRLATERIDVAESYEDEIAKVQGLLSEFDLDQLEEELFDQFGMEEELGGIRRDLKRDLEAEQIRLLKLDKNREILEKVPCEKKYQSKCKFVKDILKELKDEEVIRSHVQQLSASLEDVEAKLHDIGKKIEATKDSSLRVKEYEDRLRELNAKEELRKSNIRRMRVIEQSLTSLREQEKGQQSRLDRIVVPDESVLSEQLEKLRDSWRENEHQIYLLEMEIKETEKALNKAKHNQDEISQIKEALEAASRTTDRVRGKIQISTFVEKGFSTRGIPSLILAQEMSLLEILAQEYLDMIFPERTVSLQFQLEKELKSREESTETLNILVIVDGRLLRCEDLSGGERQAVELAFRAGLLTYQSVKNPSSLNFCVLDEPTSDVDEELSVNIVKALDRLLEFYEQLFVISYDENLMALFPERIRMEERDGISRII